jgi:hypothetical protein
MQLKIIRIRGQCRGRPPTRGTSRDGPGAGTVGSGAKRSPEQSEGSCSAVGSQEPAHPTERLQSFGRGTWNLELFVVKRRWGDPETIGSGAKRRPERSDVLSEAKDLSRQSTVWNLPARLNNFSRSGGEHGAWKQEPFGDTRRSGKIKIHLAREGPNYTCSVSSNITQDRDKDRLKDTLNLVERLQEGRVMHYGEQYETFVAKRRWGDAGTVVSGAKRRPERSEGSQSSVGSGAKRRSGRSDVLSKAKDLSRQSLVRNPEPYRIRYSHARDGVNRTCSVSQNVTQNRDKDRWRATVELAAGWQGGRILPCSEQ